MQLLKNKQTANAGLTSSLSYTRTNKILIKKNYNGYTWRLFVREKHFEYEQKYIFIKHWCFLPVFTTDRRIIYYNYKWIPIIHFNRDLPNAFEGPFIIQSAELATIPCCKSTGNFFDCFAFFPNGILCTSNKYPSFVSTIWVSAG